VVGSKLYEGSLHYRIAPLIVLSAALTAVGLVFVPFLKPAEAGQEGAAALETAGAVGE
jgi:hypothetical protein